MRNWLFPFLKPKPKPENPYGDIYVRMVAASIDMLCLLMLFYDYFYWMDRTYFPAIGAEFMQNYQAAGIEERAALISQWLARSIIQVFFFGVAIVCCQSFFKTTPGKWLMGLKIVRAKTHEPIHTWRFLLRFLGYIPACAPLMLGFIWAQFNKERRGWHDYIAGTVVLNTRPYGWYWGQVKRLYRWLRTKLKGSAMEQAVSQPPAEQGHQDGSKPVE